VIVETEIERLVDAIVGVLGPHCARASGTEPIRVTNDRMFSSTALHPNLIA
jgi:hypothetical protein